MSPIGRNSLAIVIPAYNEQRCIAGVVAALRALDLGVPHDVLVVDDGSADATAAEARGAGARVLRLVQNLGYGNALQAGYHMAHADGYAYLLQMDGDGQHSPASVPDVLAPVLAGQCDLAIGSRHMGVGSYEMPLARRMGQSLFRAVMRALGGPDVRDITSGFQAMNRATLELFLTPDFPGDYPDADVLLFLARRGMRVREVPALFLPNTEGKSMHSGVLKPMFYVYKMLTSMLLVALRTGRRPAARG